MLISELGDGKLKVMLASGQQSRRSADAIFSIYRLETILYYYIHLFSTFCILKTAFTFQPIYHFFETNYSRPDEFNSIPLLFASRWFQYRCYLRPDNFNLPLPFASRMISIYRCHSALRAGKLKSLGRFRFKAPVNWNCTDAFSALSAGKLKSLGRFLQDSEHR